jgi:hypothetical protein
MFYDRQYRYEVKHLNKELGNKQTFKGESLPWGFLDEVPYFSLEGIKY